MMSSCAPVHRAVGYAHSSGSLPRCTLPTTSPCPAQVLFDVATLETAMEAGADAITLANLMPRHWADFIRNSPLDEVKPIGTRPLRI